MQQKREKASENDNHENKKIWLLNNLFPERCSAMDNQNLPCLDDKMDRND